MLTENWFLITIALIWIIIAVIQDFRKREVANWWNFSLIAVGLSYRAFQSIYLKNPAPLLWGIFGLATFIILAYAFYYSRVFAGGDAKLLMGLGAILPLSNTFFENIQIFVYFIILLLICGSIYGMLYSMVLAIKNHKKFKKEFLKQTQKNKKLTQTFIILAIITLLIILITKEYILTLIPLMILLFPCLLAYAKAIEESCLIIPKKTKQLTIGDWLYKPVKTGNKTIKPNWEGLSEKELKILQKYKGKVLIKEGIPFTPAFLFAFTILLYIIKQGMMGWFYNLGI